MSSIEAPSLLRQILETNPFLSLLLVIIVLYIIGLIATVFSAEVGMTMIIGATMFGLSMTIYLIICAQKGKPA